MSVWLAKDRKRRNEALWSRRKTDSVFAPVMSARSGHQPAGPPERSVPVHLDYGKFFSAEANRCQPVALKKTMPYMLRDGYLKMAGGFPNSGMFPVKEAQFTLSDGSVIHVDQDLMKESLQYGVTEGYPFLRQWLMDFLIKVHSPLTLDPQHPGHFDTVVTSGSNGAIALMFRILLNEGDFLLVEEATYSATLSMLEHLAATPYTIKADKDGMIVEDLERVLTSWSDLHPGCKKPRALYAVTSGGNPTGINWSLERKRAVYDLARAHDLLILEDDAYYFLQFNRPVVPSFLSLDLDGRVVRFDSLSKVIAPGPRVAMTTGPAPLLQKLRTMGQVGLIAGSGLSQAMLVQLLRHWGHDGFLRHMDSMMEFYAGKAAKAVECAERHLKGLADWNKPSGGLFLWLRVLGVKDSRVVTDKALERRLVLVPGIHFMPASQESPYIRINYATCSDDEYDEAFRILAEVIKEVRETEA